MYAAHAVAAAAAVNGASTPPPEPAPATGDGVILVALHERNEAVALHASSLPDDPEDVLNLLSAEAAPLVRWLDAAKAYLAHQQAPQFLEIVREASSDETLNGIRKYFSREPTFERIQLLCALAAYLLEAARLERDPSSRAALVHQAEEHIRQAQALGGGEMLPCMAKAALALARSDSTAAMAEYKRAEQLRHNGRINHAPLLAQAALHYGNGEFSKAMQLYARVLRANPRCPAEVRLGIAACYYRAGKVDTAAAAFERVLALDPTNADALLGLATIRFGARDVQQGLNDGLQLLMRAYDADPLHPGVLCTLAHFKLLREEYQQALELAQSALDGADTDRLNAVAHTLLGRVHHALGDLVAAQLHYSQATRLDAKAPLPHLGTAQVYLAAGGDPTNAVTELELVLTALPGNADALKLLTGLLPAQPARVARTLARHREAAARQQGDASLQEMLGELLATTEPAAALESFELALKARRAAMATAGADATANAQPGHVPARLLNNAAVLKYRAGDLEEALSLMQEATASMMTDTDTTAMQKISMGYNMARLQEATGDLKAAKETYQRLLQSFPGYVDCYLRLAAMAKAAGDVEEARHWAAQATAQADAHIDAQAMLASLHVERGDLPAARECVTRAGAAGRRDAYMQLTHAAVVLAALPEQQQRPGGAGDRSGRRDYITKALAMYKDVLTAQPDCIFAVNGIGACLAELGHTAAAKAAFDEVVRASSKAKGFVRLPSAYVNLGHIFLGRQQYNDALQMYEYASRLHNRKDAQVLLYIARTHYDARQTKEAKRALLLAQHLAPGDMKLRFNLASVLQEAAVRSLKRRYTPGDPARLEEYREAQAGLSQAARIFKHLQSLGKATARVDPGRLQQHAEFCSQQLPNAARLVQEALDEAQLVATQQQVRAAELAAAEAERHRREVAEAAARKAEEAQRLAQAQRALEESRAKVEAMRQQRTLGAIGDAPEPDAGRQGGSKKRRKRGAAAGGAEEEFYVDDDAPIERLPKRRADGDEDAQAAIRRAGLDSDEEDADLDAGGLFGSDDDGGVGSDDDRDAAEAEVVQAVDAAEAEEAAAAAAAADEDDDDGLFDDSASEGDGGAGGRLHGRRGGAADQSGGGDAAAADGQASPEDDEGDEDDRAAPQRKRGRAALASDDDEEEGDGEDGGAAVGMHHGAAAAADDDAAMDEELDAFF